MPVLAKQNIVISNVSMARDEALSPAQKYPGGHVCNVRPDQQALLERAAQEKEFSVTFGVPVRSGHPDSLGVYVASYEPDPKILLEHFEVLKIQAWQERAAQEESKHETQHTPKRKRKARRRRSDKVPSRNPRRSAH